MIIATVISIFSAQGVAAQKNNAATLEQEIDSYENEYQEYTEIGSRDLPVSIRSATKNDYTNLQIHKAYLSKDYTYKVILKDLQDYTTVVFADANGNWFKPNDKSSI